MEKMTDGVYVIEFNVMKTLATCISAFILFFFRYFDIIKLQLYYIEIVYTDQYCRKERSMYILHFDYLNVLNWH